jgi:integrase/recombinase XerD
MKLEAALSAYWVARRRDFSQNTINDYTITFRRLAEFVGDVEFEAITSDDLNRFLNHLREDLNLSTKTVMNYWIGLSSLWTWAEQQFNMPHIMRGKVKRPRVRRRQTEAYTESDLRDMLALCGRSRRYKRPGKVICDNAIPLELRNRALILVLLDSGLRASELCDLRIRDYDPNRGRLTIEHGKGDKRRTAYVGIRAQHATAAYLETRPDARPDDPLFVNQFGGALTRTGLFRFVSRLGQRAGVTDAGIHRFRHTFAINFLRNGGTSLVLQDLLGHEELDTVRIYAKLADSDLEIQARSSSPADHWRL